MDDPVLPRGSPRRRVKLTADAPAAWIEAAVLIPLTLGDLSGHRQPAVVPALAVHDVLEAVDGKLAKHEDAASPRPASRHSNP